jgi:hypothetical protein
MRMQRWKWVTIALASGVLFSLGSCISDFGYTLLAYLPDLLDAWLGTSTTTA